MDDKTWYIHTMDVVKSQKVKEDRDLCYSMDEPKVLKTKWASQSQRTAIYDSHLNRYLEQWELRQRVEQWLSGAEWDFSV